MKALARRALRAATCASLVLAAMIPAKAQQRDADADAEPVLVDPRVAQTPQAGSGRVGQRQTREQAAREAGTEPLARIDNRIGNRIDSRLRNRIDRDFEADANAGESLRSATEEIQSSPRARQ